MFPPDVKEAAMIACARKCCLCEKPCGVGIECHHIVQETEGGPNTFDNCIPLCFDCHAEVGHYNIKHPKGTKFSSRELRARRDSWYSRVRQGVTTQASGEHLQLDRELFRKLYATLGGNLMMHFSDHDYSTPYSRKIEENLSEFSWLLSLPETEFFNPEMQTALTALKDEVAAYRQAAINRIWWETNGTAAIPQEWRYGVTEMQERFWKSVEVMNAAAQPVWSSFSNFVQTGRRSLAVNPAT